MKRKPEGGAIHIEEIQDQVELALMRGGEHEVARAYVLYREKRSQERAAQKSKAEPQEGRATRSTSIDNGVTQAARHRAPHRRWSRHRAQASPTSSPSASSRRR